MLSLGEMKSFVFARQASARREFSARLAVQKQSFLFSGDSTWPPCDKGLLRRWISASLAVAICTGKKHLTKATRQPPRPSLPLPLPLPLPPKKKTGKCIYSSTRCPSFYPNDPTIPHSHQSSHGFWSGDEILPPNSESSTTVISVPGYYHLSPSWISPPKILGRGCNQLTTKTFVYICFDKGCP